MKFDLWRVKMQLLRRGLVGQVASSQDKDEQEILY